MTNQIDESNVQYITDWVSKKAEYRNMFMVTVSLHESRRRRSATEQSSEPVGYDISLSYDGQNYGEHVSIIVYDDECYSCNSSFFCVSTVRKSSKNQNVNCKNFLKLCACHYIGSMENGYRKDLKKNWLSYVYD